MAATSVNIGGGDDQFNRYKMPSVIAKVEGRGNGIKTRIVNCFEVARALHRPPGYVCKFFGCELGAQTKIDDTEGTYIVNGSFQQSVLQEVLTKFIEMFVLCTSCTLPETDLKLKKNGTITQKCNACGAEAPCDMTHKLCTFILNNPPDGKKKKSDGKKDKAARRAAKAKKAAAGNSNDGGDANGGSNGDDDEQDEKARKKAAKKAAKQKQIRGNNNDQNEFENMEEIGMLGDFNFETADFDTNGLNGHDVNNNGHGLSNEFADDDDVQWSVDTSKEAEEARKKELGAAASILERAASSSSTGLNGNGNGHGALSSSSDPTMIEDEEHAIKLRAYIDDGKRPSKVLSKAEKLFGEDEAIRGIMMAATHDETLATIPNSVKQRAIPVFEYLGKPMNHDAQDAFFKYMEWVGENEPISDNMKMLMQVLPHMLKALYDADVVTEKEIMKWFNSEGNENVRNAVQVIIDWLNEDDDDDDESDD